MFIKLMSWLAVCVEPIQYCCHSSLFLANTSSVADIELKHGAVVTVMPITCSDLYLVMGDLCFKCCHKLLESTLIISNNKKKKNLMSTSFYLTWFVSFTKMFCFKKNTKCDMLRSNSWAFKYLHCWHVFVLLFFFPVESKEFFFLLLFLFNMAQPLVNSHVSWAGINLTKHTQLSVQSKCQKVHINLNMSHELTCHLQPTYTPHSTCIGALCVYVCTSSLFLPVIFTLLIYT